MDWRLAQEIAFGTMRMKLTLDHFLLQLNAYKKISLKLKPLLILRSAIYQLTMLDRVPLYAVVNEAVELAKKYCSSPIARFINALLRKHETILLKRPEGITAKGLSIRFSYPEELIQHLLKQFTLAETQQVLAAGNLPPPLMARKRSAKNLEMILFSSSDIEKYASSSEYYIQNSTPALLFHHLANQESFNPHRVLDLCSSPGGKLILAHDYFPQATLFANDVSEIKLERIKENLAKYQIPAYLSHGPAEQYPLTTKFDLIIADIPCSNTGVMNKRPEARWRFSETSLSELKMLAHRILARAVELLNERGKLWLMTCSILREENQVLVSSACKEFSLQCTHQELILPDEQGRDGGFAAELVLKK